MDAVITALITLVTTSIGSLVSWLLAKRRYNSEVDSNEIENLKKSLEFYERIVQDNNEKLQFYIKLAKANRVEVYRVKGIVYRIFNNACTDNSCIKRVFYTEEQIKEILGEFTPYKEEPDGNKIKREQLEPTYTISKLFIDGQYFCDTVEDCDRGLTDNMSLEEIMHKKVYGETAIPKGTYKITLDIISSKFKEKVGLSSVMVNYLDFLM